MLVREYNVDTAVRVAKEEGIEIGEARGEKKGNWQVLELLEQGCSVSQIKQRLGLDALLLDERRRARFGAKAQNVWVRKYNVDTAVRVAKEEGWKEGWKKGWQEGWEEGIEIGEARGEKKAKLQVLELLEQGCSVEQLKQRLGLNAL